MTMLQFARLAALGSILAAAACSQSNGTAQSTAAPSAVATAAAVEPSAAPTATASAAAEPTATAVASAAPAAAATAAVSFTDLAGVYGAAKIVQLAQLGSIGATSGAFGPNKPILRRDFVRWLFNTNNAIWASDGNLVFHPAAPGEPSAFKDLKETDPDWTVVQGLQDAGVSVGFPDKTFKPDVPITREQALAIASLVDCGAPKDNGTTFAMSYLPPYKDKSTISHEYLATIADCVNWDNYQTEAKVDMLGRTFGPVTILRPQAQLRRSEAALMMYRIGRHGSTLNDQGSRGVDEALAPATTSP